ncbi:DapH/DapD/GlmU-related protein [Sphingomonas koreensis]|uniref:Acyltransferase n=1 Tax=Sphingomonas koreensis TaxID=93064 RepID=A0A1L6JF65_9SPHN|nr:acyltransferase [Sphingomonas koreensis]APR54545.1 hypothetical protein BRX40_20855 [Sphingomonas koreensis]MDC7810894.1 DapH/DapD/GlmU-related protein [Sphingomonas koreensis]
MISNVVSFAARRLRGESFEIDPAIPPGYLIGFILSKVAARLRGIWLTRRVRPSVFAGQGARIKCRSKIVFQGFANLHPGALIDALAREGVVLGAGFSLGRGAAIECTGSLKTIGKGFVAGRNVGIGSGSFLGCAGGVIIGDDTILGNFVSIHSENHRFERQDLPIRLQGVDHKGIRIGSDCWIGAKATILDGVVLGNHSIVAAGAVVREGTYPEGALLAGVPARVVKMLR